MRRDFRPLRSQISQRAIVLITEPVLGGPCDPASAGQICLSVLRSRYQEAGIKLTPAPARIIPRGLLTESALSWIITSKYQYGMSQ